MSGSPPGRVEEVFEDDERHGAAVDFEGFSPSTTGYTPGEDDDIEIRLQAARDENRRLERANELANLEARNRVLRSNASIPAVAAPEARVHTYVLRPEKMRPYKGVSEGEHLRWFRDVETKFLMSPEYFTTDRAKIVYCMDSLEGDPNAQWYTRFRAIGLDNISFDYFRRFLLDLVADPASRRLLAYEKWDSAKQRTDQKVSAFKAYLEEAESHLPPFSEEHRAQFFLTKLRPELKNKILSTGQVAQSREELFAQAIMLENTLERGRQAGGSSAYEKSSTGGGSQGKSQGGSKSLENRISKPKGSKSDSAQTSRSKDVTPKRKVDSENKGDLVCYHCGKNGHIRPECPDRDKPQTYSAVGAVALKNDQPPQQPQKRGKKSEK